MTEISAPLVVHGTCPGCNSDVHGGKVTVDPEGERWHPDCRDAWRNKSQARRPGRPARTQSEEA